MSGLVFLVAALAFSVVGSLVLWLLHRKPGSLEQGIDDFSREMQALSPEHPPAPGRRSERRPG